LRRILSGRTPEQKKNQRYQAVGDQGKPGDGMPVVEHPLEPVIENGRDDD